MSDFHEMMRCSPNSVADVLRRLSGSLRTDPTNAPYLTLYLTGGGSVLGSLLQFRKDHSHQFIVTVGNFSNGDGVAEAVSYVPLSHISAVTVHSPLSFLPFLEEAPPEEDQPS